MCYKSSVSNQTVYNRFRLAAFHIQNIYNLCLFCVLSVSLCTTYSSPAFWVYVQRGKKKKERKMGIMEWSTHFYCWLSFVRNVFFFLCSRYEANAKWIQMNSAKRNWGDGKMRRANIHKCICVLYNCVYRMGNFICRVLNERCWAYMVCKNNAIVINMYKGKGYKRVNLVAQIYLLLSVRFYVHWLWVYSFDLFYIV